MLCQKCKINNANVKIIRNINGDVKEMYLCSSCAGSEGIELPKQLHSEFFQNPFFNMLAPEPGAELICKKCGTSYYEFKKSGKFGCAECVDAFSGMLPGYIKNIQGATAHTGKLPRRSGAKLITAKKIENLKKELKKAVSEENFELAVKLRDEIRELEGGMGNEGNK